MRKERGRGRGRTYSFPLEKRGGILSSTDVEDRKEEKEEHLLAAELGGKRAIRGEGCSIHL